MNQLNHNLTVQPSFLSLK